MREEEREGERESMSRGRAERQRERERERGPSRLSAVSTESDTGLHNMNGEILT